MGSSSTPGVIVADGAILERILEAEHRVAPEGLSRSAFRTLHAARSRTTWGAIHERWYALVDGEEVLASAMVYDLAAMLDGRPVRVCGIGSLRSTVGSNVASNVASSVESSVESSARSGAAAADTDAQRQTQTLVAQLVETAARAGADLALLCGTAGSDSPVPDGFEVIPMTDVELTVAESARPGAPMVLVRSGEDRDLAAISRMGMIRAGQFRFHLTRDVDYVKHAITKKRLLAGVAPPGRREVQFVIAEEGITAAAYVVLSTSGQTWTVEECGDRDPSGARVGALLQALIAREPAERRPDIRAWLPPGFLPPQVTVRAARQSAATLMVRSLTPAADVAALSHDEVLWWRGDIF